MMKVLEIHGSGGDSAILVGERLKNLREYLPAGKVVVITDANVRAIYQKDFPVCDVIEIGTGEKIKTLETVQGIYQNLLVHEADRSTFIVGIGGGIVCDVAGFVASTYMRGLRFGFVPSTLLSQVDASVGGKNGVNFGGYKNIVGVFNQPEFVICDQSLLRTLPKKELLCGFAEIVKHAVIGDAGLFSYLEGHHEKALRLDDEVITKLVYDSVVLKASIVNRDEKEKGERMKLNFGHTFGHAIEKNSRLPHGEAVSIGMAFASALSAKKGYLPAEDKKRILKLLQTLNLSTRLQFDGAKVLDALKKDKKRERDQIHFVLLQRIGHAVIEKLTFEELASVIHEINS